MLHPACLTLRAWRPLPAHSLAFLSLQNIGPLGSQIFALPCCDSGAAKNTHAGLCSHQCCVGRPGTCAGSPRLCPSLGSSMPSLRPPGTWSARLQTPEKAAEILMSARPAPLAGCARTIFCAAQHSLLRLNLRSLDLLRCTSKNLLAPEDVGRSCRKSRRCEIGA